MYKIISCPVSEKVNQFLKDLLIMPVVKPVKDSDITLFFPEGAELEPLTRHAFAYKNLYINQIGYASYTLSNLRFSTVGRYCSIAQNVRLMGDNHPTNWATTHTLAFGPFYKNLMMEQGVGDWNAIAPHRVKRPLVDIGNDVWIGRDVTIAREIKIGDGAIIASGAIVTKDVEPYSIVGGVPAKHIRYRFDNKIIERLLSINWWEHPLSEFSDVKFNDVNKFCDVLVERKSHLKVLNNIKIKFSDLFSKDFHPLGKEAWL